MAVNGFKRDPILSGGNTASPCDDTSCGACDQRPPEAGVSRVWVELHVGRNCDPGLSAILPEEASFCAPTSSIDSSETPSLREG
jgi:hypothetical protein